MKGREKRTGIHFGAFKVGGNIEERGVGEGCKGT